MFITTGYNPVVINIWSLHVLCIDGTNMLYKFDNTQQDGPFQTIWYSLLLLDTRDDTSAQQFFYYINIYVRLHVSTIEVVIIRSLIEITGLQKAALTFWDPN